MPLSCLALRATATVIATLSLGRSTSFRLSHIRCSLKRYTYSVSVTPYGELITCLICKVTCCGRIPYSQHLQGALHRKRSNHQEPTSCSICDKHFCSSDELNLHLSGIKHRKKALLASSTATVNETASGTFKCIPCNLECSSQLQLSDHLKGRKHLKCIKFKSADWNCDVLLPSALTNTHSTSEDCTASVGQKGRPFATNTSKSLCSKSEYLFER
ncbi:unnamed protein product, partial [Dicrocoelium dendriticum]